MSEINELEQRRVKVMITNYIHTYIDPKPNMDIINISVYLSEYKLKEYIYHIYLHIAIDGTLVTRNWDVTLNTYEEVLDSCLKHL